MVSHAATNATASNNSLMWCLMFLFASGWVNRRQRSGIAFNDFRCVEAQVLAEAAGDQLDAERDIVTGARGYGNARQSKNGGSEYRRHRVEDAFHRGLVLL